VDGQPPREAAAHRVRRYRRPRRISHGPADAAAEREVLLLGGNGILLENHVGRFVADAEAIYSYEGTREINTLIVGRAITGTSAFDGTRGRPAAFKRP
jgi:hypothetical protein